MQGSRIGVIGTGYMGRGVSMSIERQHDLKLCKVLTRRNLNQCTEFPYPDRLTDSVDDLIEHSDLIIDCSGDVLYSTEVLDQVVSVGLPIITMNTNLQLVVGSYLATKGLITEAEGNRPGSLAVLHKDMIQLGFRPLVYGNVKGYLNKNPSREQMVEWSKKLGVSIEVITAFTDGTKLQLEQALVANALALNITQDGLHGIFTEHLNDTVLKLAEIAKQTGSPISDYIVTRGIPRGVFIIAEHDVKDRPYLNNYELGEGPYYLINRQIQLPHLEVLKTIYSVLNGGDVLMNNGVNPTVSVAAIAKRNLRQGEMIYKPSGSFEVRGFVVGIDAHPDHIPIGLLQNAVIRRDLEEGHILQFEDVDIPESLALKAWNETMDQRFISEVM